MIFTSIFGACAIVRLGQNVVGQSIFMFTLCASLVTVAATKKPCHRLFGNKEFIVIFSTVALIFTVILIMSFKDEDELKSDNDSLGNVVIILFIALHIMAIASSLASLKFLKNQLKDYYSMFNRVGVKKYSDIVKKIQIPEVESPKRLNEPETCNKVDDQNAKTLSPISPRCQETRD